MHDESLETCHTRTVPSDMRVHRKHIQSAFLVRDVEFGSEDLLNQVRRRQRATGGAKVREIIQYPFDGQFDYTRGLSFEKDLVGIVAPHQAAVIKKTSVLDLLHGEPAEMPRRRPISDGSFSRHLRQVLNRLR